MNPDKRILLERLFEKSLARIGLELVDIEHRHEAGGLFLRVYVDREGGVDLEACASASRILKDVIETGDSGIMYDYLEVSSPGLDRIIKTERDLLRFTGYEVKVKTLKGYPGPRKITGILKGFSAKEICILDREQNQLDIPRDVITVIRLHPDL